MEKGGLGMPYCFCRWQRSNTLTEDLYIAAYVSLVGKDSALILGTLTHICFLIPAFIVFRKLSPPRKMHSKKNKPRHE